MIYEVDDDQEDNLDESERGNKPREELEFASAKAYLQTTSSFSGDNLYDHLTDVLNKILAERPENVIDFFEEYSRKVKEKRFKPLTDHLEDIYIPPGKYAMAKRIMPLLKPIQREPSTQDPEDLELADMSKNDMTHLLYYFEHSGLGLPRVDMFCLTLSMRQLVHSEPIISIRFWGKIFGLYKDYYIIEAELKEAEIMKRNEELQDKEVVALEATEPPAQTTEEALEEMARGQEVGGEGAVTKAPRTLPAAPIIDFTPPPEVPSEFSGVGANKKVFYVCNELGTTWEQLPNVTPKQIQVARRIYVAFTGNLDTPIVSYPEFPGTEREYLRVQIARISAGTQISPLGFYTFGAGGMGAEDEEEEEEAEEAVEGAKTTYRENPKYEPVPMKDLVDGSMAFWVHHTMYILPQGRTTWWNPSPLPEGDEAADEELGEGEEEPRARVAGPEPETGPPLLTPCSEDATLETTPAWSVRCSSRALEEFSVAVARSNIWPGAYCFTTQGKTFQNVYMGYGVKYMAYNFSPEPLPPVQQDYVIGPEIMEMLDPTGAEEEAWRIAHLPKPPPIKVMGEEPGEGEEEEEEDEDDDD